MIAATTVASDTICNILVKKSRAVATAVPHSRNSNTMQTAAYTQRGMRVLNTPGAFVPSRHHATHMCATSNIQWRGSWRIMAAEQAHFQSSHTVVTSISTLTRPSATSQSDEKFKACGNIAAAAAAAHPPPHPSPVSSPASPAWPNLLKRCIGIVAAAAVAWGPGLLNPSAAAASTAAVNPLAAVASAVPAISAGDTAWVLTSTALVLFMTIPGLALFYGGLVRQKNALSVLLQCLVITALMTVQWALFGYSMSFSSSGMAEGVVGINSFIGGLDKALPNLTLDGIVGTIPEALWFMFQATFAIITPALIVGAFAERIKFSALVLFTAMWAAVVYYPTCHAVWGGPGSFFGDLGVLDFAGGIVVHITAGIAALVSCIMVGPRKENSLEPHNLGMTVMGTGMLWVGWFGFNGGSALTASAAAAMAMAVTQISAATAALAWMFLDMGDPAVGRPTSLGVATGAVAGLAAITPAAGFVGPLGGLCIGLLSGVVCRLFATKVKEACGYDDSLDVFGVHGVGGIVGTLALAVFASPAFGGNQVGMDMLRQLGLQTFASVAVAAWTAVGTVACLKAAEYACGGLRVSEEEEMMGLDKASHDEDCYYLPGPAALPATL